MTGRFVSIVILAEVQAIDGLTVRLLLGRSSIGYTVD